MTTWEEPPMFPGWEPIIHTPEDKWLTARDRWYAEGKAQGFCSDAFCWVHDAPPHSPAEIADFDEGIDDCLYAARLFTDPNEHGSMA